MMRIWIDERSLVEEDARIESLVPPERYLPVLMVVIRLCVHRITQQLINYKGGSVPIIIVLSSPKKASQSVHSSGNSFESMNDARTSYSFQP